MDHFQCLPLMDYSDLDDEEYFSLDFDIQYHYDPTKYVEIEEKVIKYEMVYFITHIIMNRSSKRKTISHTADHCH
jgi:hypothetical protein